MTSAADASSHTIIEHEAHIVWLLEHPGASDWLKAALRSARACDPMVLNIDLQLLSFVLGRWVDARITSALDVIHEPGRRGPIEFDTQRSGDATLPP